MTAAAALAVLLKESRLSIAELARRAGVSRASLSEYLHERRQPGFGQIERLAAAANRTVDVRFSPAWAARKQELEDVLALADALPLRELPPTTRTWRELTSR